MAGAPASGPRQPRRGPAPFASFDHDVSDESSPESKKTFQLPEIREDPAGASPGGEGLAPPEQRARSHSSPAVAGVAGAAGVAGGALQTPAAPRIDISRASSSSHHDSRDSSPEMALFAGTAEDADTRGRLELGFREDGALELRSSTEELAFLEGEPPRAPAPAPPAPAGAARRHSRRDSQGSEAALLGVSGRTSRLSSVGSQCSAHSALSAFSHASRVSRLSVVSGASRSPSPHKMLLETSFCGPKPIETEPELCVAAVEERLLRLASAAEPPGPANTRDRREVRTEVTVESTPRAAPPAAPATAPAAAPAEPPARAAPADPPVAVEITPAEEKRQKETRNRARAGRSRERRDGSEPEVYKNGIRSKDIIRIRLKPDSEYEDDDEEASDHTLTGGETRRKPATLELHSPPAASPAPSRRRTPSPAGAVSRKSSFCSLFKSRETIASPDSPSGALRRKKSVNEGRSRSKSRDRDRSATPTSAKIRGSVLSLFKTPRRSAASPSPGSRASSPGPQPAAAPQAAPVAAHPARRGGAKLKYYEDTRDGVIHIPLRTPPDERAGLSGARRPGSEPDARALEAAPCEAARPASAPQPPRAGWREPAGLPSPPAPEPVRRQVLSDGVVIIPLHSPTERRAPGWAVPEAATATDPEIRGGAVAPESRRGVVPPEARRGVAVAPESRHADDGGNGDGRTGSSSDEGRADAPTPPEPAAPAEGERARGERRLVFTTHVGSREQVFSTQFSITKTPSVTSEISGSLPSFPEASEPEQPRPAPPLRDTHIAGSPSGSEASSEAASPAARGGSDVEQRGLVVQESFEDELPYVPTTLPLERSLALPMVPVRERARGVPPPAVRRPRAAPLPPPPPGPPPPPPPPPCEPRSPPLGEKLRIKLPRRPRTASAGAPARTERPRTRSGGDGEFKPKTEWIDFEEVPERRKQPKRIQTLPASAAGAAGATGAAGLAGGAREVVFSYVEPEECRCECHAARRGEPAAHAAHDSSPETEGAGRLRPSVQAARPFVADFDLEPAPALESPPARPSSRRH